MGPNSILGEKRKQGRRADLQGPQAHRRRSDGSSSSTDTQKVRVKRRRKTRVRWMARFEIVHEESHDEQRSTRRRKKKSLRSLSGGTACDLTSETSFPVIFDFSKKTREAKKDRRPLSSNTFAPGSPYFPTPSPAPSHCFLTPCPGRLQVSNNFAPGGPCFLTPSPRPGRGKKTTSSVHGSRFSCYSDGKTSHDSGRPFFHWEKAHPSESNTCSSRFPQNLHLPRFLRRRKHKKIAPHTPGVHTEDLAWQLAPVVALVLCPFHSQRSRLLEFNFPWDGTICTIFRKRSTLFVPLGFGRWALAVGLWPLGFGCWALAVGLWPWRSPPYLTISYLLFFFSSQPEKPLTTNSADHFQVNPGVWLAT